MCILKYAIKGWKEEKKETNIKPHEIKMLTLYAGVPLIIEIKELIIYFVENFMLYFIWCIICSGSADDYTNIMQQLLHHCVSMYVVLRMAS